MEGEKGACCDRNLCLAFSRQLSLNVLRSSFLELATSFLGASRLRQEKLLAFRKSFAGSHSNLVPHPRFCLIGDEKG